MDENSSLASLIKPFGSTLLACATAFLASAKFWLAPTTSGSAVAILRYVSDRYRPELCILFLIALILMMPRKWLETIRNSIFLKLRDDLVAIRNVLKPPRVIATRRIANIIFTYGAVLLFIGIVGSALPQWMLARARLLKWSQRDFVTYTIERGNQSLAQLHVRDAETEFSAIKNLIGNETDRHIIEGMDDLGRIQRFAHQLVSAADQREKHIGPNKGSYELYVYALLLLPEDKQVREIVSDYLDAGEVATQDERILDRYCTDGSPIPVLNNHKRLLAFTSHTDFRPAISRVISSSSPDLQDLKFLCAGRDTYDGIFLIQPWDLATTRKLMEEQKALYSGTLIYQPPPESQ